MEEIDPMVALLAVSIVVVTCIAIISTLNDMSKDDE